jgi:hypothetical protein
VKEEWKLYADLPIAFGRSTVGGGDLNL